MYEDLIVLDEVILFIHNLLIVLLSNAVSFLLKIIENL